jgi:aldose 1-epimerase
MIIEKKRWGDYAGEVIWLYSIKSETIEIDITNYGCTIVAIRVKGRNVILGYSGFDELQADKYYMGCLVGRFAGRISKSSFEIDGKKYQLTANDGSSGNHLHGGLNGFNRMLFGRVGMHREQDNASITFHATSDDLDEGYPGSVDITFSINLNAANEITLSYFAKPDRPTHINLTHHLYYNLCLPRPGTVQHLAINADSIAETGEDYIPTGRIVSTPEHANFLTSRPIPTETDYNECYVLNKREGMEAMEAMEAMEEMEAMEAMEAMKAMETMKGMEAMETMKGMEEMETMKGMEAMEAMTGMEEMEKMETTEGMEAMAAMAGTEGMEGMEGTGDTGETTAASVAAVLSSNYYHVEFQAGTALAAVATVAPMAKVPAVATVASMGTMASMEGVPGQTESAGLTIELSTTCPAIVFYSGQFLDTPFYPKQGICLEAQYIPDSPNHKNFPSTLYDQEKSFKEHTTLHFKNII